MPRVSLIVSAYNIENHIRKCIESLIYQSFKDIEIIVVNDGSTDNTLNEIQKVKKKDARINVINQSNEGAMKAREIGFKEAKGEYLLFVDGDDWLAEDAIEILYKKAKQNDYDIVCYKFYFADGESIKKSSSKNISYQMLVGDDFLKMIMTSKINPSLWSKFIKRKFIINSNINFPNDIVKAEDLAFTCSLGMHNPIVCLIDEYLYYYFTARNTSATNSVSSTLLEVGKATNFIQQDLRNNNIYNHNKEEFEFLSFIHTFWVNRDIIYNKKGKVSKTLFKNWKGTGINIKKNKYFKELMLKEPLKIRVISNLLISSYLLGSLFYKFYNIYILLTKGPNSVKHYT
ncbi:glycosyltransferase family 2 protein [Virgibacillus sp. W0181]|uniref:glycosyltransferase family 2 protein n=1 Tax=Virgibacillus sp. W0181 TaxID=3391581 RepID=UPI003F44B287